MLHLLLTMIDDLPSMSWRLLTRGHPAFLDGFSFFISVFSTVCADTHTFTDDSPVPHTHNVLTPYS